MASLKRKGDDARTLNSDGVNKDITRVGSFEAPLDRRKSTTSKLVRGPALAFWLQQSSNFSKCRYSKINQGDNQE